MINFFKINTDHFPSSTSFSLSIYSVARHSKETVALRGTFCRNKIYIGELGHVAYHHLAVAKLRSLLRNLALSNEEPFPYQNIAGLCRYDEYGIDEIHWPVFIFFRHLRISIPTEEFAKSEADKGKPLRRAFRLRQALTPVRHSTTRNSLVTAKLMPQRQPVITVFFIGKPLHKPEKRNVRRKPANFDRH